METEQEIFRQVEEAVRTVLNTEEGEIKMETKFRADLDAESIDFLDINFEVEKRTGVELDFVSVMTFLREQNEGAEITDLSISDLVNYIVHLKNKEK